MAAPKVVQSPAVPRTKFARDAVTHDDVTQDKKHIVKRGDTLTSFAKEDLCFKPKGPLTAQQEKQLSKRVKEYEKLNPELKNFNELVIGDQIIKPPPAKLAWTAGANDADALPVLSEAPVTDTKNSKKTRAPASAKRSAGAKEADPLSALSEAPVTDTKRLKRKTSSEPKGPSFIESMKKKAQAYFAPAAANPEKEQVQSSAPIAAGKKAAVAAKAGTERGRAPATPAAKDATAKTLQARWEKSLAGELNQALARVDRGYVADSQEATVIISKIAQHAPKLLDDPRTKRLSELAGLTIT